MQVIQSILVPKGTEISQLASRKDLTYLIDAKDQRIEHEDYDEFVQIRPEDFTPGSLELAKLDATTQVRVGVLKEERPDALVYKDVTEATGLDSPVPQPTTVADVFHRDKQALIDTIYGALGASGLEVKKRRQLVFMAIDAFKTSMGMLIDQMAGGAMKMDQTEDKPVEWFKDKEEFEQFVTGLARATAEQVFAKAQEEAAAKAEAEKAEADAKAKEDAEKAEAARAAKEEADAKAGEAADAIEKIKAELEAKNAELEAKVAELTEKADKIGGAAEVDAGAEGPEGAEKGDKDKAPAADPKDWGLPLAAAFVSRS